MTDTERMGVREGDKLGRYLLERLLVRSRVTRVFLARYEDTGSETRRCVVRCVVPSIADPGFIDAFMSDARIASGLVHPNLGRVIDVGLIEGTCYVASELVRGVDLLTALGQSRKSGAPFPVDVVLWTAHEVCEGLRYLHELTAPDGSPKPVVHRNVALSNVLLTDWGMVHLIDFGVSGAEGHRASGGSRDFIGRADYVSPEQLAGGTVDARSDIFSLGVIMHELLTGHRLFHKDGQKISRASGAIELALPSRIRRDLPPQVDALVMRALELAPEERFESAGAMQQAIRAQLLGEPSEGRERLAVFVKERFAENLEELDRDVPPAAAPPEPSPEASAVETASVVAVTGRSKSPPGDELSPAEKSKRSGIRAATITMWFAGLFTLTLAAGAGWFLWNDSQGPPWWTLEAWQESTGAKLAQPEPIGSPRAVVPAVELEPEQDPVQTKEPRETRKTGQARPAQRAEPRTPAPASTLEGELLVVCLSSCTIYVDGRLVSPDEPGGALTLPAGDRALRVVDDSTRREVRRQVLVAPGRVRVEEVRFTPTFNERTGTEEW